MKAILVGFNRKLPRMNNEECKKLITNLADICPEDLRGPPRCLTINDKLRVSLTKCTIPESGGKHLEDFFYPHT